MILLAWGLFALVAVETPARPRAVGSRPAATRPAPAAAAAPMPSPTPRRPPAPPGLSWADADAVDEIVARLTQRLLSGKPAAGETVVVTERQLNSYLNLSLGPKIPPGVSGLQLLLDKDRLGAQAFLDLDQVKQKLPRAANTGLLAFLSGTVPVVLSGRLACQNGRGRVELETATVAGVGLPASMLAQIVALSTRSATQPQGFDLLAPFPLPWMARQVRLEPGRAFVDFYPTPAARPKP